MAQIKVEINDAAVLGAFNQMSDRLSDLTPFFQDLGEMLVNFLDRGFKDQIDPYQTSWAKLASSTLKQKVKRKRILKINQSTGILRATLSYQASSTKVLVGYNTPYAIYVQTGTRRMPKRQILPDAARGLPLNLQNEIINIVKDHLDL